MTSIHHLQAIVEGGAKLAPRSAAGTSRRTASRRRHVVIGAAILASIPFAACSGDGGGDVATPSDATTPGSGNGWAAAIEAGVQEAADAATDAPATVAPAGDDGPVDVCALLPSAEVSAAFGVEFDQGTPTHHENIGGDQCIWNGLDAMAIDMVSLTVQRNQDVPAEMRENGIDATTMFHETRRMTTDAVDLPLGDEAYSTASTVHVLDGETVYDLMTVEDSPGAIAALQALAATAMQSMAS